MTISIGLGIPTYGAFPGDAWSFFAELADIADAGGVETCWVPDHVTLPEDDVRANGGRARVDEPLDAWTVLAMIAARTNRLRVGTEVTPLPLRHPVLLAQTVVTLDTLSNGRAVLGLGGGWYRDEFEQAGIAFRPYRRRLDQTREGARLVRALLDGETVSSSDAFYELRGACVRARGDGSRPPIWFGGRSENVLRLAAELGDGWITATNASAEEVEAGRDRLHALLREAGRPADSVTIAVPFVARVADTTERARADVEAYIERGAFEGFAKQFLEDATRTYGIWGSAQECARKLSPYLDLGVGHVILDIRPPDNSLDSARRICGELIPLLEMEVMT
jgi:alkanesulfonate monooxygenase SsuD/methylene tetrahydromethanopterin reductase-like flavin-dependent oxidoreductase (luciferase family)